LIIICNFYISYHLNFEGQTITWLTPHLLQQVVSNDVDIPTMLIFLQFYEVGFILMFIFSVITINKTVDILLRLSRLLTILWGWFYINVHILNFIMNWYSLFFTINFRLFFLLFRHLVVLFLVIKHIIFCDITFQAFLLHSYV